MANKNTLKVWLQELYDTEANLTAAYDASEDDGSKTLLAGRLAFDSDSNNTRYKIGDGETAFANLPWNYATIPYGECTTAQTTAAKTVTIDNGFVLAEDTVIGVKFTNGIKVAAATLNVNNTGAKNIWYSGANTTTSTIFTAKRTYLFRYNGTQWELLGDLNTDADTKYTNASLGQGYGTCETEAATAAKVVTLSGYTLVAGGFVSVKFTNAVNVANVTLNINSKGAKSVFYHGAATTATEIIPAGAIATFVYDGTHYHFIAIDDMRHSLSVTGGKTITLEDGYGNSLGSGTITYAGIGALKQDASISLTGDVTGSGSFSNGAVSITTTVGDNSHNHVSANISDRVKVDSNDTSALPTLNKVNSLISTATADLNSTLKLKGTIGSTGATDTVIPPTSAGTLKEGYGFRVITTGFSLTAAQSADGIAHTLDTGDLIVYNSAGKWILIPAGDDVTKIEAGEGITTAGDDSSVAGDPIIGEGTISLRKSGVTANTYGPDQTAATTASNNVKIKVPKITVDKYGRVTSATTIEFTAQNTDTGDTKVKQTTDSGTTERALILNNGTSSGSAGEVGMTNTTKLKVKPSTGDLTSAGDMHAANFYAGGLTSSNKGTGSGETVVGKLNAWNLVQTPGDVLILNGNI